MAKLSLSEIERDAAVLSQIIPDFHRDLQRAERAAARYSWDDDSQNAAIARENLKTFENVILNDTLPALKALIQATFKTMPEVGKTLDACLNISLNTFRDNAYDFKLFVAEMKLIRNAAIAQALAGTTQEQPAERKPPKRNTHRKPTTNELMLAEIERNPESCGWSVTQWQRSIKRGRGSIGASPAWKRLQVNAAETKAAHAIDRSRRTTKKRSH